MGFRGAASLQADSGRRISRVAGHLALAWGADTGADLAKTNVNGTTLVNALEQRGGRYGLQAMCDGGGMANATIIERLG
jgi:acetyl-CoA acyltransferase